MKQVEDIEGDVEGTLVRNDAGQMINKSIIFCSFYFFFLSVSP